MRPAETFVTLRGGPFDGRQVCVSDDDFCVAREEGLVFFDSKFLETDAVRFDVRDWQPGDKVLVYRWNVTAAAFDFTGETGTLEETPFVRRH